MRQFDGLLMRDGLHDDGRVPSPGYPYHSPDIIPHEQVADPKTFFAGNYDADVAQPIQLGTAFNRIYVRSKNLSQSAKNGYKIHLYRAKSSLFTNTSLWRHNQLKTTSGATFVELDQVESGKIAVGNDHFLLSGLNTDLFCLIGIAHESDNPVIPENFSSYSAYVTWQRTNQNVCGRNLRTVRNFPDRNYEREDHFHNPESVSRRILVSATAIGDFPGETEFGVECKPCNVSGKQKVKDGKELDVAGRAPANFDGEVLTWVRLPSGATWPRRARVETEVLVEVGRDESAYEYGVELAALKLSSDTWSDFPEGNRLMLVGGTGTVFIRIN